MARLASAVAPSARRLIKDVTTVSPDFSGRKEQDRPLWQEGFVLWSRTFSGSRRREEIQLRLAPLLHQFHHDPLRTADERQVRSGVPRQWPDCDLGPLRPQVGDRRIQVLDGEAEVL